jgi:Recombination endonuclease VII
MIKDPVQARFYEKHRDRLRKNMRERAKVNRSQRNAYLRGWRKRRPDLERGRRIRYLLKRYGLTLESYQNLIKQQKGLCCICHRPMLPMGATPRGQAAVIDHKGPVRGILCSRCNIVLGMVEDNSEILKSAIIYLEKAGG